MKAFANPYHHLDHKGRLAGAFSEPEHVRESGPQVSMRRWVGASMEMTPGSHIKENPKTRPGLDAQADVFWKFSSEPVDIHAPHGPILFHYMDAFKTKELLAVKGDAVPLEELAKQRIDAI